MINVFIAEEIPSLNKGEAAILFGMLESFRSLGAVNVSLLSLHPELDKRRYADKVNVIDELKDLHLSRSFNQSLIVRIFESIRVLPQYLSFITFYKLFGLNVLKIMEKQIWKEYCDSDLIVIGHDGMFGGMFGQVHFSQVYNLFIAKMLKKHIVIYGASIEPFKGKLRLGIAKFILSRVDLITVRDKTSYRYLQDIGINMTYTHLTSDLAYLMPSAPLKRVQEIMSCENIDRNTGPIIGITATKEICCLAFSNIENLEKRYQKSVLFLSRVVDHLIAKLNAMIVFIPHCIGPAKELDDRNVAKDIYQLVENKHRVKVIDREYTPEELKGLVSQCDLFIGERLHSVVGAISMYVPSIAILYPAPRNEILSGVLDERSICNIETLDIDTLISKISEFWLKKEEIKNGLIDKVEFMKERALLNGELLKNLLGSDKQ